MAVVVHNNVALLQVESLEILSEIRSTVPLDEFVVGQVSPTELIVNPKKIAELNKLLSAAGLQPLLRKMVAKA